MGTHKPKNPRPGKATLQYTPTPPQLEFQKAIDGGARVVLFVGGIRSGKTTAAVWEAVRQIYVHKRRPNLGWIVSPTYPMSLVPERKLKEVCYKATGGGLIAHERRGERAYLLWPPKGWNEFFRVEVKSADEPDRLRGVSLAWAVMDEAAMMSPETYQILLGRLLDSKGILILSTTPRGLNWVHSEVYKKSLTDPRYAVVVAKTDTNPYLSQDEIADLREKYAARSTAFARQELDAEFTTFEGLVFTHFQPYSHVVKEPAIDDATPVYCGVDWGYNDPFVCVFLAKLGDTWVVLDEYYKTRGLLREHAEAIRHHPLFPQVKRFWCDPSSPQNRREMMVLLKGAKLFPARRPDKNTKTGWAEMRARLLNNMFAARVRSPWGEGSVPGLVYADKVRSGVIETTTLCYKRFVSLNDAGEVRIMDKGGTEVERNATESIEDKNNHFVDALGYCLFSEVRTFGGLQAHYRDEGTGAVVPQKPATEEERKREAAKEAWEAAVKKARKPSAIVAPWDPLGA